MQTETHYYDGHWSRPLFHFIVEKIDNTKHNYSSDERRHICHLLQQLATPYLTDEAWRCLDRIVRESENGSNWDAKNHIHSFDLLFLIAIECSRLITNQDEEQLHATLRLLAEQCHDMRTGMCPQGRTTRLFQVLLSLVERQ